MIYTVTLNPCLDYVIDAADFALGRINRSSRDFILPGGKGLNVSQVLNELGQENTAVYFSAGSLGDYLGELLAEKKVRSRAIKLAAGRTRINVKLRTSEETAVNAPGPTVSAGDLAKLYRFLQKLQPGDVAVLSGHLPPGAPADVYARIGRIVREQKAEFVLDAAAAPLLCALPEKPWFIKPNHEELAEILQCPIENPAQALAGARRLQQSGARHVLVSLGSGGAVLLCADGSSYGGANPPGQVKNTVGAGDAMTAAFLTALLQKKSPAACLALGIAAGSATAFSDELAKRAEIAALLPKVVVEAL